MNTLHLNNNANAFSGTQTLSPGKKLNKWFTKQANTFEATRFGMMAIYITVQSCVGAVAAMYILQNNAHVLFLATAACITMASNAVFIAQGSGKLCLVFFYLCMLINTAMIIANV